jgi:hypothetical protein
MTAGTSPRKLLKGAARVNAVSPVRFREKRQDVALMRLRAALQAGNPVLLVWTTAQPGDHWVAVVGLLGHRFIVADAAENELVLTYLPGELADRWDSNGLYEGIIL